MEVAHVPSEGGLPPQVPLSLHCLLLVQHAQAEHGLRHGDYGRYRQYCTRRLRRLYKVLKLTHGRGRYQKRRLEPHMATDVRYLHVALVRAERSWAHAMELKNQIEAKVDLRKRLHLIRRLAKAAFWASELVRLTAERGDTRTGLEAEGYAAWMDGNVLLEKEVNWEAALAKFQRARKLFEQLAQVGGPEQQVVCRKKLEEIERTTQYCSYQIRRRGGDVTDTSQLIKMSSKEGAGGDLLQSKLAALAAEDRALQAARTSGLEWQGTFYPVQSHKVREALAVAQDQMSHLSAAKDSSDLDHQLAAYDKLINAYNEAKAAIRSAMSPGADASNAGLDDLKDADVAVRGTILELTIEWSARMVAEARSHFRRSPEGNEARPSKPEDVVRLYDTLAAHVAELGEVAIELGGLHGEALMEEAASKGLQIQAARTYFVAHSFLLASKYVEAFALLQAALQQLETVMMKQQERCPHDEDEAALSRGLQAEARAWRCFAHARALEEHSIVSEGVGALSLAEGAAAASQGTLGAPLDSWESLAGRGSESVRVAATPPGLELVAARPIVLDSASEYVAVPSLEHRAQKKPTERPTAFGRLFGWRS